MESVHQGKHILTNSSTSIRLIVASQYTPLSILDKLLPFLSGSRPVVFFSIHKEFLTEAYYHMKISDKYLNVQLTESWLRRYQVLPGRTHPQMTTTGGGGYILSATRVLDNPNENPVEAVEISDSAPEAKKAKTKK
jgi:tRNA (adenine-N(1)-)-methyltransferase non-catalytic subunit